MDVSVKERLNEETDKPEYVLKSPKFKAEYYVKPSVGGFVFYHIKVSKGAVPKELRGQYTSSKQAIEGFKEWERRQKKSHYTILDERHEARKARKNAAVQSEANE